VRPEDGSRRGVREVSDLFTASYRAFVPSMGQPVVTSLGLPRWRPEAETWPRCWLLTPTWALFNSPPGEFERGYAERLDRFGAAKISRVLERIAREHHADRLVLLCHELDGRQCHRADLATWLLARAGQVVTEITRQEN
jgi:Protein of unknown function, DUF488